MRGIMRGITTMPNDAVSCRPMSTDSGFLLPSAEQHRTDNAGVAGSSPAPAITGSGRFPAVGDEGGTAGDTRRRAHT